MAETTYNDVLSVGMCPKMRPVGVAKKRSRGLGAVGGRKSPSPIDLAHGLYNSLYYRTSRDYDNHRDTVIIIISSSSSSIISHAIIVINITDSAYVCDFIAEQIGRRAYR